jgi:hypothetical protein
MKENSRIFQRKLFKRILTHYKCEFHILKIPKNPQFPLKTKQTKCQAVLENFYGPVEGL